MDEGELFRAVLGDPLAQFPGGGSWAQDADVWTESNLMKLQNQPLDGHDWSGYSLDQPLDFDSFFDEPAPSAAATKQAAPDDSFAMDQVLVGSPGMGYLPPAPPAAGADQVVCASLQQTQVPGTDPPPPPPAAQIAGQNPLGADQLEPAADVPTAAPDGDVELAWIFSVAALCGEADGEGTVWSEEEQSVLLRGLALHANDDEDVFGKCLRIAYHLPKKTALDVALRWRWLKDKNKTVKQPELVQKDSVAEKVKKGKGTTVAKNKSKLYPLSKEAKDSKSTKELIEDNDMFLKRIEDNLKSGQLDNTADYFYYVKTNIDVIEKRGKEFGINMITMPPINEEGLEEILWSHLN